MSNDGSGVQAEIDELEWMWRKHGDNPSTRGRIVEELANIARKQAERAEKAEANEAADSGRMAEASAAINRLLTENASLHKKVSAVCSCGHLDVKAMADE